MSVVVRLAALLVAIGLVVGAFALRDDDGGRPEATGPVAARCPTELRALCDGVAGTDEATWSHDRAALLAEELGTDADRPVLLPAAWADLVDAARARAGRPALVRSDVLASSPLLLVALEQRAAVLARACGIGPAEIGWACIGEHAGRSWSNLDGDVAWGDVRAGHLPPDTASGLLATAGVVAARTGPDFSLRDLEEVDVITWSRTVERAVLPLPDGRDSYLAAMGVPGPPAVDVATVLEAELATTSLTDGARQLVVSVPQPLYAVELLVAGVDGGPVQDLAARIDRDRLRAAGWRVDGQPPQRAPLADLPAATEAPDGGVLSAVRSTYEQVS